MIRRTLLISSLLVLSTFAQTKQEKIVSLLDLMNTEANLEIMKDQFKLIVRQASPTVPSTLMDSLFQRMSKESLYEMTIPIYERNLEEKTIDSLIEFYSSDAGQAIIRKMPLILQESMQAGAAWGAGLVEEFLEEIRNRGYPVERS